MTYHIPFTTVPKLLKGLASGAFIFLLALCASSAPFDRWIEFTQPDGTVVRIHGTGDEFSARFETADGYTVVFDKALRAYCFARQDASGALVSTGVQVGQPAPADLQPGVRMTQDKRRELIQERYQKWESGMQTRTRWEALKQTARRHYTPQDPDGPQFEPPRFPTVGTKVGLTMLIDFSDEVGTVPQAEIVNYLNGDNYTGYGNNGSVKKYYQDNSDGLLTYTNVVTVYIRAPQPKSTYADVTKDAGTQGNLLIKDCIEAMKALPNYQTEILPLFDALTTDAQNRVLAFNVFYAGDDGGVWSAGLWPHSWVLAEVGEQELSPGGKRVWFYQITNIGNRLSISTFAHENGHMLCGYPDLYDYDYDSVGGAGSFCLMGSGGHGQNPSQICAYLKRASGWATITELTSASSMLGTVSSAGENFNHFYRYQKPGIPTEYYLVENRQQAGRDAGLPGAGMAVWHCDELGDRDNQSVIYNTAHANYECTLVQADNRWDFQNNRNDGDAGDLWYEGNSAAAYQGEFSDDSQPSARWWDGTRSGLMITDISPSGQDMTFRVGFGMSVKVGSVTVVGGNGNAVIDPNECNQLFVALYNDGDLPVTGVSARLSSSTPGVIIAQPVSAYQDIASGQTNLNVTAFQVSTSPAFICGTPVHFTLSVQTDLGNGADQFQLASGMPGVPVQFSSAVPVPIPDASPVGAESPIVVTNVSGAVQKVTVAVHLTHTWVGDLKLQLISPSGVTNTLSDAHGLNANSYGLSCLAQTTFDDEAALPIGSASPPFVGIFSPDEPLSIFQGLSGTNLNGIWKLRVVDSFLMDVGTIQCWSLNLHIPQCQDGLGECPGSDLGVSVSAVPNPSIIGQSLAYTIDVTNRGPSTAKSTMLNQVLPPGAIVNGLTVSQGTASQAGGVVSCNFGAIPALGKARLVVRVTPVAAGTASSSVTVSSEQPDFNLSDNSVTIQTQVNPPTCDLAVSLNAVPPAVVLGETVVLTVSVVNNGPSAASPVIVTNVLPAGLSLAGSSSSQGSISTLSSNLVVCSFGTLTNNGRATATLRLTARGEGQLQVLSRVVANQFDPISANNSASVLIAVGPAADLALGVTDFPDSVLQDTIFTWVAAVTNRGPSQASGVVLTMNLPEGVTIVSSTSTSGNPLIQDGVLTCEFGTMSRGAVETVTLEMRSAVTAVVSGSAQVAGIEADLIEGNNSASVSTTIAAPFIEVVAGGATLTAETLPNGAIDIGETNTVVLRLRNAGNIGVSGLTARLLTSGGVTPIGVGEQVYGNLDPGWNVGKPFTFVANGANGAIVTATLELRDGTTAYPPVAFAFHLPNIYQFSNTAAITIPSVGQAAPYPSEITVSGVTGMVGRVTATVSQFSHTYPKDVNILMAGPAGNASLLMSHAGKASPAPVSLTFDDSAAGSLSPLVQLASGVWKPSSYSPAPVFPLPAPAQHDLSLSTFNGRNPNGKWSLFVADDNSGDAGSIQNGWSLTIVTVTPVNQVADLSIAGSASPVPAIAGSNLEYTFVITNAGPDAATGVTVTNSIPAAFVSAEASQGTAIVVGNSVVSSLDAIPAGDTAIVRLVVRPGASAAGSLACAAAVAANETDLNQVRNVATVSATVGLPIADLAISQSTASSNLLQGRNVTIQLAVMNHGPGTALGTTITNPLPAGMNFVSALSTRGSAQLLGNAVVFQMGDIEAGGDAEGQLVLLAAAAGAVNNQAVISSASTDSNLSNNSSTLALTVEQPRPDIRIVSKFLQNESLAPANGTVENGETVTMMLGLQNVGTVGAGWVTAILEPVSGMTLQGNTNQLHVFYHGLLLNTPVAYRPFVFTASGAPGTIVRGQIRIINGSELQGVWPLEFAIPSSIAYANTSTVLIPESGSAMPYPSTISIANAHGYVKSATVTLTGITHSFPKDLNVLLVAPNGKSVALMANAGGERALNNVNLNFMDGASSLPQSAQITSGNWRPTAYGDVASLPAPAPAAPYGATLANLAGSPANGTWSLFVLDDVAGDSGQIAVGWSLALETLDVVNPVTDLAVSLTANPAAATVGSVCTNQIVVSNHGPAAAEGVVITNVLPAGAQLVRASASTGTVQTSSGVVWQLGTLANAAAAACTVEYTIPTAGEYLSTATVASWATDFNLSDNTSQAQLNVSGVVPVSLTAIVSGGVCQIVIAGLPGTVCETEWSADLQSWTTLSTGTIPESGELKVTDPEPATAQSRFYRVR